MTVTNSATRLPHLPDGVVLPDTDVRTHLNERAVRGWTESTRRLTRVIVLVTSDILAGFLGVATVLNTWEVVSSGGRRPLPDEVPLLAMVFCLMPLALRVTGAYAGGRARVDLVKIAAGVFVAAFLGWIQAQLFGYSGPELPNKAAYLYSAVVITGYACCLRLLLDQVIASRYSAGVLQRKMLVIGSVAEAEAIDAQASRNGGSELRIVGRLSPAESEQAVEEIKSLASRVPFFGSTSSLDAAFRNSGASGVIVVASLPFASLESLVSECFRLGATVSILPQVLKRLSGAQIEVRQSTAGPLLLLRPVAFALPQLAIKRLMDVTITSVGLVVILPLLVAIAVAIKLDSKGPVLFRQTRIGVGGRRFNILKFRTMVVGADAQKASLQHLNEYPDARLFKIKDDPRVTPLGRVLRKLSLDELPQLWNVIRGDMSLVGPRPFFPGDLVDYDAHHFERLHVLPGITGLWQVSGRSDVVDFEEVVRLDRQYIREWSLISDLIILIKTIPAAFSRGAY